MEERLEAVYKDTKTLPYLGVSVVHPHVVLLQNLGQLDAVRHRSIHLNRCLHLEEISKQHLLIHQQVFGPFYLAQKQWDSIRNYLHTKYLISNCVRRDFLLFLSEEMAKCIAGHYQVTVTGRSPVVYGTYGHMMVC